MDKCSKAWFWLLILEESHDVYLRSNPWSFSKKCTHELSMFKGYSATLK